MNIFALIITLIITMNELARKRGKIIKQIIKEERLNYFKARRSEFLNENANIQQKNSLNYREALWLNQTLHRSLVTDGLLQDFQRNQLLKKIQNTTSSTSSARDIEIILVILSNALLDNLTLDYKVNIAKLCISCFQIKVFNEYSVSSNDRHLSFMLSKTHCLNSMSKLINYVEQKLEVQYQEFIFSEVIKILSEMKDSANGVTHDDQASSTKSIEGITNAINNLICCEQKYISKFYQRFQRNSSYFNQILKLHSQFLFMNIQNPIINKIHNGLLFIQEYLTSTVQIVHLQVCLDCKILVSIITKEIYLNRDYLFNKAALKILDNLFTQHNNSQITIFLSFIQTDIHLNDKFIFFTKLLSNDSVKSERMKIIYQFLLNDNAFSIFQPFFQRHWKELVDRCCQLLQQSTKEDEQITLETLILIKLRYFEGDAYFSYLKSIGMYNFLNEKCQIYESNTHFSCQNSINEQFYSKLIVLLDLFKQDQENSI